jgi:hypothetical protein
VCSFVCCVSFDRGVILCDVCYLFVVSYCKPLPPGKNPFAVKINNNNNHSSIRIPSYATRRDANKSLAFSYLQHEQNNFSWMG